MVTHIPKCFELYKSVKIFTGQGVERNNDIARGVILRKSNKWDSAGDVLRQEQRQWELRNHEREACGYVKRKSTSWDEEITRTRQKRHKSHSNQQSSEGQVEQPSSSQPEPTSLNTPDFSKMTLKELKNELKLRNAKGFSKKNKVELIQQLEEICQQGNI